MKYNLGKPTAEKIPQWDKDKAIKRLYEYLSYDRHFSPINIDTSMARAHQLMNKYGFCTPTKEIARLIEQDARDKGQSTNTIVQKLYVLEYLAASQGTELKLSKPTRTAKETEYLSATECRKLIDASTNLRDAALIALLVYAGPRASEVSRAWLQDYDSVKRTLIIKDHGAGVKNKHERTLQLTKECNALMTQWVKGRPAVEYPNLFITEYGKPLGRQRVNRIVKETAKKAKISKRVHAHMLRHSFCSNALIHGIPLTVVAAEAGHRSLASTYRYLHANQEAIRDNIDKLHF